MIISFTGDPGSGKSTLGKMLAEKLHFERYYIGQIRRDMAKKKGMTLAQYNEYGEKNPETDKEVDDYQKNLGETDDDFIIEGRTSWFLIPQSIKIYVSVDPKEGARRIFSEIQHENERNEGTKAVSIDDVIALNEQRKKSDDFRYKKYYGKDCFDHDNFDFVLDTTNLTIEEAFDKLCTFISLR